MESNLNHLRNLIHFAHVDGEFHPLEMEFVRGVGERLGISPDVVEKELQSNHDQPAPLPENEIRKFVLLDDIMNLMAADNVVQQSEIDKCKTYARDFGFDGDMIDAIAGKIKNQLESGAVNTSHSIIKNELFKMTNKNKYHEKYS